MYSSAIIPKHLFEQIDSSFFERTCLTISSINLFWMWLCIYFCWPGSRWLPYQEVLIEPGHSHSTVWKVVLDCHYCHYLWNLILGLLEKRSPFLWISEARKSSWTKRLDNCVFSFQIVSLENDNQDQADIVLECYRCFRLWIFPHLCALFLRFEAYVPPPPQHLSLVGPAYFKNLLNENKKLPR